MENSRSNVILNTKKDEVNFYMSRALPEGTLLMTALEFLNSLFSQMKKYFFNAYYHFKTTQENEIDEGS